MSKDTTVFIKHILESIDLKIIWDTVTQDLPVFKKKIELLLNN